MVKMVISNKNEISHVTHHCKAYECNIPKKHLVLKTRSWELLTAKINFSETFCDDVIITFNDQNWRKIFKFNKFNNICIRQIKINMPRLFVSRTLDASLTFVNKMSDQHYKGIIIMAINLILWFKLFLHIVGVPWKLLPNYENNTL